MRERGGRGERGSLGRGGFYSTTSGGLGWVVLVVGLPNTWGEGARAGEEGAVF